MNPRDVLRILGGLRVLRFFPNDEAAMNALVQLCGSMCSSIDQVRWLVARMTSGIYDEWPGVGEMRGCFCNRYKPKDGINAYSTVYPDGLPPDPTVHRPEIEAPQRLALPPGNVVTTDPDLDVVIQKVAEKQSMRHVQPMVNEFTKMLKDIETPPHLRQGQERPINLDFKPITQEDIDRAREEFLRAKRARESDEHSGNSKKPDR